MLPRRAFIRQGTLFLASALGTVQAAEPRVRPLLRIGLLTDLHYADKESTKTRFYRETPAKLAEAVERFNAEALDFVVELGDLIDQAGTVEQEIAWLQAIEKVYAQLKAPRHYVLGNHCVTTLTKAEFAAHTAASKQTWYAFDAGGTHFIVLDACFRADGAAYERHNAEWTDANIPPEELDWLRGDLSKTTLPAVILAHQRLDDAGKHSVKNAAAVRALLEAADGGKVIAVFQGHSHQNDLQQIAGIPYVTLAALIEGSGAENNSYGILEVMPDHSLRLRGFRRQVDHAFPRGG